MEQCFTLATKFFSHFFTGAVGGASGSLRGRAGANIRRTRALVERENEKFLAHLFPRPQRVAQQVRTRSGSDGVQSRSTAQVECRRRLKSSVGEDSSRVSAKADPVATAPGSDLP